MNKNTFFPPDTPWAFEHGVWLWHLRCGFPVRGTFSILIGHTDWLARCLPTDHFWATTNVTVLKVTTLTFNRARWGKWWEKKRNNQKKKNAPNRKSPGLFLLPNRSFHAALSQMQYASTQWTKMWAVQRAWRGGWNTLHVLVVFWFKDGLNPKSGWKET